MSENAAKVCLVRCPTCENLLPEVTNYPVYQCGGCGAVLRARSKPVESAIVLNEENGVILSKNSKELENFAFSKSKAKNSSLGLDQDDVKSNGSIEINKNLEEMGGLKITHEFEDLKPRINGSRESVQSSIFIHNDKGFQDSEKIDGGVNEGPSSYHSRSHHEYADLEVEDNRAELLRKLDELKDQIVLSRLLGDKSKEKVSFFNDPIRSQIPGRAPIQEPIMPFEQIAYHPYFPGEYSSKDSGHYRQFHHPSCSCLICYSNHHQAHPPPTLTPPPRPPPVYYHHDYIDPRFSTFPKPYTQWSNDPHHLPRGILASGGRRCHPVAGGSPFVACCNCFELLQVPEKRTGIPQKKMRCAACSEVILLSIVNKRLLRNSDKGVGNNKNTHGTAKWCSMELSSEDYDNSGDYHFQSLDILPLGCQSSTSYKSMRSIHSTSSSSLEDEGKLGEDPNPVDISVDSEKPSSPPLGSPLQDHSDYSTKFNKAALCQNSMKDAAVATEIEISSNEYCGNTGTSQESVNTRGGESFFLGMIKKSFRELSRSSQHVNQGKVNVTISVTVNGHPIPEGLVKKAERLSGPIQPGDYWYDSRAGFWGVMGGPCCGIIPPLIEKINYPMPENCADGHTAVFVNRRELHVRDLDLLASRGLPTDRDKSYIIEMSGKVLDEGSGNELLCLGKLAPTVERKKHGFGMKPPRTMVE